MADERSKLDANYRTGGVICGVTDDASLEIKMLRVDPTTKRLKVAASIDSFTGVVDGEAVEATDTGTLILGTDGSNYQVVAVDSSGNLQADIVQILSTISTANSSAAALGIDAVFTGTGEDVSNYASIEINVFANKASATDGLSIQFSSDNTNWDHTITHTITADVGASFVVPIVARYFRIVYTNGGTAQTAFRLQTIFQPVSTSVSQNRIDEEISGASIAALTKSVITGVDPGAGYTRVKVTTGGSLKMSLEEIDAAVLGQEAMAASLPVVIASDQSAVAVDTELPAAGALGDALANPTTPMIGACLLGWDVTASKWERLKTDESGVLLTKDTFITTVLGEVQATPTANTVLARLKTIADAQLADGHNVTVDNASIAVTGTFWQTTQPVSLASVPSHAVTNAGTFAVQVDGDALTALQLIDDVVFVDDTAVHATGTTKGIGIMAAATPTDGSVGANDIGMVAMSVDRRLHVDAQIVGTDAALDVSGATVTVDTELPAAAALADSTANPTLPGVGAYLLGYNGTTWDRAHVTYLNADDNAAVTGVETVARMLLFDGSNWDRARGDSTDGLLVNLGSNNDVIQTTHDNFNCNANVQAGDTDVAIANPLFVQVTDGGGTNYFDVDSNNRGQVDIAAVSTELGFVAHDAADAGNPVKIGGRAQEPTAALEEVTADNDRVDAAFDRQGRLAVWMGYPVQSADINDATSGDNTIQAAAGAGLRIAVMGYHLVSDGTVDFRWEDGAGGTAFTGQPPLQAREGVSAGYGFHPMWVGTANTLLNLELSAAINVHGQVSFVVMTD